MRAVRKCWRHDKSTTGRWQNWDVCEVFSQRGVRLSHSSMEQKSPGRGNENLGRQAVPGWSLHFSQKKNPNKIQNQTTSSSISPDLLNLWGKTCAQWDLPVHYPPKYLNSTRKCTWSSREVFPRLEQITLKLKTSESMGTGMSSAKKNIWITEQQG